MSKYQVLTVQGMLTMKSPYAQPGILVVRLIASVYLCLFSKSILESANMGSHMDG